LQELAQSVGITKAALFHHFKSKHELFFEVQMDICRVYGVGIRSAIEQSDGARQTLRNVLLTLARIPFFDPMKFVADEYQQLSAEHRQEIDQAFSEQVYLPVEAILEHGMKTGELRQHNKNLGAGVLLNMAMLLPSPGNPVMPPMPETALVAYIDEMLDMFWLGVSQNVSYKGE
jgi:TetR/AcrR family transcriptional regulator, cholesterol catabolism regulator